MFVLIIALTCFASVLDHIQGAHKFFDVCSLCVSFLGRHFTCMIKIKVKIKMKLILSRHRCVCWCPDICD